MDKKTAYNEMLDKLKEIIEDFDNEPYRDDPEVEIRGEGRKIKKFSGAYTTPYNRLIERLKIFYSEHEKVP